MKKLLLLVGLVVFLTPMVVSSEENDLSNYYCIINETNINYVFCFCENDDGQVSNVNGVGGRVNTGQLKENYCKSSKEITYGRYIELKGYLPSGKYKPFGERKYFEEAKKDPNSDLFQTMSDRCKLKQGNNEYVKYKGEFQCVSVNRTKEKISTYDELAIALGCGIKKNDIDDCVKRYLAFFLGTGPMTMEEVDEIKKDKLVMGEIVHAIEEMHRANNQSENQEPTEEEKAFAQAQEQGLINNQNFYKMYDPILEKHLNSRGWTQVNPKLEKILNSIGRSQIPIKNQKRFTTITGWKF